MAAAMATELPDFLALLELQQHSQWVAWKYVVKNGRQTKPPVNPHTGEGANHSNPRTWGTYQEAMAYAKAHNLPGVGYVMTDDDDLTGVDLDHCRDADFGHLEPWAEEIIRLSETYAEVSPSGTGVRLIWRGKIDQTVKCGQRNVEIYKSQRYLTITGGISPVHRRTSARPRRPRRS
jgi:primase-polymerase (primpol)-like protein